MIRTLLPMISSWTEFLRGTGEYQDPTYLPQSRPDPAIEFHKKKLNQSKSAGWRLGANKAVSWFSGRGGRGKVIGNGTKKSLYYSIF